jgi:hypothetical protein
MYTSYQALFDELMIHIDQTSLSGVSKLLISTHRGHTAPSHRQRSVTWHLHSAPRRRPNKLLVGFLPTASLREQPAIRPPPATLRLLHSACLNPEILHRSFDNRGKQSSRSVSHSIDGFTLIVLKGCDSAPAEGHPRRPAGPHRICYTASLPSRFSLLLCSHSSNRSSPPTY